jgi:hypothetical protein
MAHTGYFQSEEGQFGCISCNNLGNYFQELEGQTSCQVCPSNTQRFIGVLDGASRSSCQCKEGAIVATSPRWLACACICARRFPRALPPQGTITRDSRLARFVARHQSFPCAARDESTARFRVCRSVRNVRGRKHLRRLRRRRLHALCLRCVLALRGVAHTDREQVRSAFHVLAG